MSSRMDPVGEEGGVGDMSSSDARKSDRVSLETLCLGLENMDEYWEDNKFAISLDSFDMFPLPSSNGPTSDLVEENDLA